MKPPVALEALAVLVVVFGVSFMLTMDCLSHRSASGPVTTPLAVLARPEPAVVVLGHLRRQQAPSKPPVVVVPVVVGAANCPEPDESTPCLPIYDFREHCSLAWKAKEPL
jgi:hypothetical protein